MIKKHNKSLSFRKGNRTLSQFKKDIQLNTAKEEFLMKLAVEELKRMGYTDIAFIDNGISNSGKLIEGPTGCCPDYLLFISGKQHLVEIKNSSSRYKCTFKVHHLQEYIKQNAHIILFYGTGPISKNPKNINYETTRWTILTPQQIQKILDQFQPYKDYCFGNKLCVQILKKDFPKFWKEYKIESQK